MHPNPDAGSVSVKRDSNQITQGTTLVTVMKITDRGIILKSDTGDIAQQVAHAVNLGLIHIIPYGKPSLLGFLSTESEITPKSQ